MPKTKAEPSKKAATQSEKGTKAKQSPPKLPPPRRRRWLPVAFVLSIIPVLAVMLVAGFMLMYAHKIYPGISVDGTYLGGLSQSKATANLTSAIQSYQSDNIPINYGKTSIVLGIGQINTDYQINQSIAEAYAQGRGHGIIGNAREIARSLIGRKTRLNHLTYDDSKLTSYFDQIGDAVTTPVANAGLTFSGSSAAVVPAQQGQRLDTGQLVRLIQDRLINADSSPIAAPVYSVAPVIDDVGLSSAKSQADGYLSGPITLKLPSKTVAVNPSDITGWISVSRPSSDAGLAANLTLDDFRYTQSSAPIKLNLNDDAITAYVAALAKSVDQTGQNAQLTIQNGVATVFQPSRTGYQLDQPGTVTAIKTALAKAASDRAVAVNVKTISPAVTEANLNSLGINELISEGVTYFPGSPAARMQNIRVGASKFNGVLVAPDQVFSFESLLGNVDAAAGYAPALVILGNKEVYQYGGGMCQVSSTAFRAALLAGLPIVERHNHSFAVGYYTAPYGVPGVDATVFDLSVDFKFRNDTGHYILIQTILSGTTLKFDFYGTKTKSGQIRGPYFSTPAGGSGWNATVPSTTYFYRDILDTSGNVTKTDTFTEHYASSNDFPVEGQFH